MGILDILGLKDLTDYGKAPMFQDEELEPALLGLLEDGCFLDDALELIEHEYWNCQLHLPDVEEAHWAAELGEWYSSVEKIPTDYCELFQDLFYEYLGWDIYRDKYAKTVSEFLNQCLVPIINDYYVAREYDRAELLRDGYRMKTKGTLYLIVYGENGRPWD